MGELRPRLVLVAVLAGRDPLVPRVLDAASAEAQLLLDAPFASRAFFCTGRRAGDLRHGAAVSPLFGFDWHGARSHGETHDPGALFDRAEALAPPGGGATLAVTDVALAPPPRWRYLLYRPFGARGAIVSLAALDPRYWGEADRERAATLKRRLRAALVAALGPLVGLEPCREPGCFLDRGLDGIDALDAMERVGRGHAPHPAAGRRFRRVAAPLGLDAVETSAVRPRPGAHPRAFERRPPRGLPLHVRWAGGPAAALELFGVRHAGPRLVVARRHVTPWAPTVRPPVESIELARGGLEGLRRAFERAVRGSAGRGVNVPRPGPGTPPPVELLRRAGGRLYDLFFPAALDRGLPRDGVFLELGIDERLLALPFELMHDRDDFLALKHPLGRFVNASCARPGRHAAALDRPGRAASRALVVGVARARSAPAAPLEHAEVEAEAAAAALARLGARVTALLGPAATVDAVYAALREGPHVLHYAGHAAATARGSRLLLRDGDLPAAALARALAARPPALAVLDACATGRTAPLLGARGAQGLADSLLLAGSYVVATAFPVGDAAALAFATRLYADLLDGGQPLGIAVQAARRAARTATPPEDISWAAWLLYGDPRIALLGA